MGDLFHKSVPDAWIDRIFGVMGICKQHKFQVLTKRSKRMQQYMTSAGLKKRLALAELGIIQDAQRHGCFRSGRLSTAAGKLILQHLECTKPFALPLPNVWLGVSVEDQASADERIPDLLNTPAAVRFVSAEPLLGPIQVPEYMRNPLWDNIPSWQEPNIDWIIAGGESGPGFRPMQIEWAESTHQQCEVAGTAFFFKQDSGAKSGQRGRASDALWACKEFPK